MSSTIRSALLLFVAVAGCDDDGDPVLPDASEIIELPWWTPEPGEANNWDMQLAAPLDVSGPRQMYVLDLWDVATATTIDYGGGSTVSVPAGPLAGKIADLHAAQAIVVCHIDTGAIALDDPDAMKFAGFEVTPPDRPAMPAVGSVIGWSVIADPNTRYLDIRAASRATWEPIMRKRFELADSLGCDAVTASWIDQIDSGFPIEASGMENDFTKYYTDAVAQLHLLELSAGMHVTSMTGKVLSDGFAATYDFILTERCAEFEECDLVRRFSQEGKAVFGIDFENDGVTDRDGDLEPDGVMMSTACLRQLPQDWIHKDADPAFRPSSAYRMDQTACP